MKKAGLMILMALIQFLFMAPKIFSQYGPDTSIKRYGVNGWGYNMTFFSNPIDSSQTGMKMVERDNGSPGDSAQVFKMAGDAVYYQPLDWFTLFVDWVKFFPNRPKSPSYCLIDLKIRFYTSNITKIEPGIQIYDTTNGSGYVTRTGLNSYDSSWRTIKFNTEITVDAIKGIDAISIWFYMWTKDIGYTSAEFEVDNLRLLYKNGSKMDTLLIDDFQTNTSSGVKTIKFTQDGFALDQNYPNPFNPVTTIRYQIPVASKVNVSVYDMLGQEVSTIVDAEQTVGNYEVPFDGSNLPSGTYIYALSVNNQRLFTKKMLLVK